MPITPDDLIANLGDLPPLPQVATRALDLAADPEATVEAFRQVVASDHYIHGSNISEGGTLGNANRNLIDYFQISFDPTGAAIIDYADDHQAPPGGHGNGLPDWA